MPRLETPGGGMDQSVHTRASTVMLIACRFALAMSKWPATARDNFHGRALNAAYYNALPVLNGVSKRDSLGKILALASRSVPIRSLLNR